MRQDRRRLRRLLGFASLFAAATALRAHPEWNDLHLVYSAPREFVYPFDGRTPKVAAVLLNHHLLPSAEVKFSFSANGTVQSAAVFPAFPDGGSIVVPPDEVGYATVPTGAIYDGRFGAAPAVGETKSVAFNFTFKLAGDNPPPDVLTIVPGADNDTITDPPGQVNATVKFTNLGDTPVLTGPVAISGQLRFPATNGSPPVANVLVEIATPFSNWLKISTVGLPSGTSGPVFAFSQAVPFRNDWQLRFSADGYETRTVAYGYPDDPHQPYDITMAPLAAPELDYRRAAAITTPTGFWRGAVAESEGTFVAFPGQATWPAATTEAAARALRTAGRIVKYKFDGTKLWEHAPGWETWAGDMTSDGKFVAYALNPTATSFYTPTENKLVLLDGATGAVIWSKAAAPTDAAVGRKLDSLEVAFSPDGKLLAVGSTRGGQVTLVDRATGNFLWSVPGATPTFGAVRRLKFSADAQFLFVGSGDSTVRKLRVSDGAVLWRIFTGGSPSLNGLDLSPDGTWLAVGTASLDATLIRTADGFTNWRTETQFVDAVMAPDGRHVATLGGQIYRVGDGALAGMTKLTGLSRFTADGRWLLKFDRAFTLHDLGGKLVKTFSDTTLAAGQSQWAHVTRDGRYAVMLARDLTAPSQTGIVIFERIAPATATAPTITAQPLAQSATLATTATLTVGASGTAPLGYQWRKNGVDLAGATSAVLSLPAVTANDAAAYSCLVTNSAGSATSNPASVSVVAREVRNPARLSNLSVGATLPPGSPPLIVGFTVGGAGNMRLLLRGIGPSLAQFGATNLLPDPRLALLNGNTVIATNNDWAGDDALVAAGAQVGAFPLGGTDSKDAALAALPFSGGYSIQLGGNEVAGGAVLAEIYDRTSAFNADSPRLTNLSARYDTGGAAGPLAAGFVIAGPAARTVLIRGIGPALTQFGVTNALADPQLVLFRDNTIVATNDNWFDAPNSVALVSATAQVGAFALPPAARDAALLLSLPPGNYTAQVRAPGGAAGNALVEIYEVP